MKTEVFCCLRFRIFEAKILFCVNGLKKSEIFTFIMCSLRVDSTDSLKSREVPPPVGAGGGGTSLFFMESVESARRLYM